MNLKEKIIFESLKLFSLKGFIGTSIHDILTAANTSKGGFYNHFKSKEDLFFQVLEEARRIWREKNLKGLEDIENPIDKIKKFLENFRDLYLKDAENFPGGSEELAFYQVLREGTAVDRNELSVDARTLEVDSLGDQFLAGSCLTLNQDRGIRGPPNLLDKLENPLHRLANTYKPSLVEPLDVVGIDVGNGGSES